MSQHNASVCQTLWYAPEGTPTSFPCVDCGLMTGNFCDGGISVELDSCFASERVPTLYLNNKGQRTPLCTYCESHSWFCRFCRKVPSCTPPNRSSHWSGVPLSRSRQFNPAMAEAARARISREAQPQAQTSPQDEDDQRMRTHLE